MDLLLNGLDCAHCAEKIRCEVENLPDVERAEMNFMAKKLTVTEKNGADPEALFERVRKIVSEIEPDVSVTEFGKYPEKKESDEEESDGKVMIIRIILSAVLAAAGIIAEHFIGNEAAALILLLAAYLTAGYDVLWLAVKNLFRGKMLDEHFLMAVASVGAFAIGEYAEGAVVMLLYQIGEYFQDYAVEKSRKSIAGLMELRPDSASVKSADGKIQRVSPENVRVGDVIVVAPGERVPLDGVLLSADCSADTSALTGESVPRTFRRGEEVMSGVINQSAVMELEVSREYGQSTVARILEMVENASARKAPAESFITKFARFYTPCVVAAAVLLAVIPMIIDGGFSAERLYPALSFLVVSCPCALVISVPLSYFGGIGGASKNGILIKGGSVIDALCKADTVVFDKTGTLTEGVFEVTEIVPAENSDRILTLCAKAERFSTHPAALSVKRKAEERFGDILSEDISSEELSGMGVKADIDGKTVLAGNKRLMDKFGVVCENPEKAGTVIHLSEDGKYLGYILISDRIKPRSAEAVKRLKQFNMKTVMLTGDREAAAREIGERAGIDKVYSGLMPDQKASILEELQKDARGVIFAGDGINDAPVLMAADAGFAMGGIGSDAAIEAADAVIMDDDPMKIAHAMDISAKTGRIVKQNIVFALAVKLAVLILAAVGIANMWAAVFADVGVSMLAVLNAMRAGRYKPNQ